MTDAVAGGCTRGGRRCVHLDDYPRIPLGGAAGRVLPVLYIHECAVGSHALYLGAACADYRAPGGAAVPVAA